MAKRIIQGFIFALTLVALSSCAINQTFDKWDLRNEAAFEGESGVIGVVHASLSGACDSETGEIILYGPDGKKEQADKRSVSQDKPTACRPCKGQPCRCSSDGS